MPVTNDEERKHFERFDDRERHRQHQKGLIRTEPYEKAANRLRNLHGYAVLASRHPRIESRNVRFSTVRIKTMQILRAFLTPPTPKCVGN